MDPLFPPMIVAPKAIPQRCLLITEEEYFAHSHHRWAFVREG